MRSSVIGHWDLAIGPSYDVTTPLKIEHKQVIPVPRLMPDEIHPLVKLLCEDRRYKLEAYQFVRAGLAYAQEELGLGSESSAAQTRREMSHTNAGAIK